MINLKPCPFCGTKPKVWETMDEYAYIPIYTVGCTSMRCAVRVETYKCRTKEEAAEIWNTRKFQKGE